MNHALPLPRSPAPHQRSLPLGVLFLLVLAGALALGQWLGVSPDNDGYTRLARTLSAPAWLRQSSTKPIEMLLARLAFWSHLDALWAWRLLGAAHAGALAVLLYRISRFLTPAPGWLPLLAPPLALASPFLLAHFLAFNSVATLALTIALWCERELADSPSGALVALAGVALSRVEGALFVAPALALAHALLREKSRRARAFFASALVLAGCALLWLLVDRLTHGQWLGILTTTKIYMRAAGTGRLGPLQALAWLSGGWLTYLGKPLVLAMAGSLVILWRGPGRRELSIALLPLTAGCAGLCLLGILGKPIFYRFLVAYFPLGVILALAVAAWLVRESGLQRGQSAALALLLLALCSSYLWRLGGLSTWRDYFMGRRQSAQAALACLAPALKTGAGATLVVADNIMGPLAYALREAPVAELTYEREFATRPALRAASDIFWIRPAGAPIPNALKTLQSSSPLGRATPCPPADGALVLYRFVPGDNPAPPLPSPAGAPLPRRESKH